MYIVMEDIVVLLEFKRGRSVGELYEFESDDISNRERGHHRGYHYLEPRSGMHGAFLGLR